MLYQNSNGGWPLRHSQVSFFHLSSRSLQAAAILVLPCLRSGLISLTTCQQSDKKNLWGEDRPQISWIMWLNNRVCVEHTETHLNCCQPTTCSVFPQGPKIDKRELVSTGKDNYTAQVAMSRPPDSTWVLISISAVTGIPAMDSHVPNIFCSNPLLGFASNFCATAFPSTSRALSEARRYLVTCVLLWGFSHP